MTIFVPVYYFCLFVCWSLLVCLLGVDLFFFDFLYYCYFVFLAHLTPHHGSSKGIREVSAKRRANHNDDNDDNNATKSADAAANSALLGKGRSAGFQVKKASPPSIREPYTKVAELEPDLELELQLDPYRQTGGVDDYAPDPYEQLAGPGADLDPEPYSRIMRSECDLDLYAQDGLARCREPNCACALGYRDDDGDADESCMREGTAACLGVCLHASPR